MPSLNVFDAMNIDITSDLAPTRMPAQGKQIAGARPNPKFFLRQVVNPTKTALATDGMPVMETIEYVRIYGPGEFLNVPEVKVTPAVIERFAEEYGKWRKGLSQTATGMPIEELPGLTNGQIAVLKAMAIETVDLLADVNDSNLGVLGMGGRALREKARAYKARAKDNAALGQLAEQKAALEELKIVNAKQIEELRAQLAALSANKPAEVQPPVEIKRGPGRPPKEIKE